jgi:hypothetical protein
VMPLHVDPIPLQLFWIIHFNRRVSVGQELKTHRKLNRLDQGVGRM